jgi:hypothetical protein
MSARRPPEKLTRTLHDLLLRMQHGLRARRRPALRVVHVRGERAGVVHIHAEPRSCLGRDTAGTGRARVVIVVRKRVVVAVAVLVLVVVILLRCRVLREPSRASTHTHKHT